LLTHLAQSDNAAIFYLSLETEPESRKLDPKYLIYEIGSKNEALKEMMQTKFTQNVRPKIEEIKDYFNSKAIEFKMFEFSGYFKNETRIPYYRSAIDVYKTLTKKTIAFADPDVGADIGITQRFRLNKNLYLMRENMLKMKQQLKQGDYMAYFQHLGNTNYTIDERIRDLKNVFGENVIMFGYLRIQAAIVLLFSDRSEYEDKKKKIQQYIDLYQDLEHRDKIIFV